MMEWENWKVYVAPLIVVLALASFIYRWKKASDAKCCGGRCGCAVSRKKKKREGR